MMNVLDYFFVMPCALFVLFNLCKVNIHKKEQGKEEVSHRLAAILALQLPSNLTYQPSQRELLSTHKEYLRVRQECIWYSGSAWYQYDNASHAAAFSQDVAHIPMHKCNHVIHGFETLRIARIGPMYSKGGYDWHVLYALKDPLDMNEMISKKSAIWVTSIDTATAHVSSCA